MNTLLVHAWASSSSKLAAAVAVTLAFATAGRVLRGVTLGGAVAGAVACLALFVTIGPGAFVALVALFAITWLSTRLGHRRKQKLGLAEKAEGRNAGQVLANLAVSAGTGLAFAANANRAWLIAAIAALAEAATDTVASEIGQSGRSEARMITTWERVPPGTDGGISLRGTLSGLAGGVLIVAVANATGILARSEIWIPLAMGFVGMLVDSLLGATIQSRGWISNQAVNFVATLAAAVLAYASYSIAAAKN